jgi:threonine-phosphate decarboxylase
VTTVDPDAVADAERVPHGGSDDPDAIDFSANTNPRVPDGAREAHEAAFDAARRYPNDGYPDFRAAAAAHVDADVPPERVVPTAGGLSAIRLAVATHLGPGETALVPTPSFGEYAREVRLQGGRPRFVPNADLLAADPAPHALAVVCTPNNPTGAAHDPADLRAFAERCRAAETTLLVDEAFLGFADLDSVADEAGVVVARSLTKLFGLPGLRAGFAVASDGALDRLATARETWSLSAPAAAVGAHCLRDRSFVAATRERVRRERERLRETLSTAGYGVHPSDAPFLLLDVGDDVDDLLARADRAGLVLRDARPFRGLDSHVRVAVREPTENDQLLEVLTGD